MNNKNGGKNVFNREEFSKGFFNKEEFKTRLQNEIPVPVINVLGD